MVGHDVEIERKYEVDAGLTLAGLADVAELGEPRVLHLTAVYVDTPDLALRRAGVVLRRRTGGRDDGWHLKLPAVGDARVELSELADGHVPASLRGRLAELIGEAPLVPVAELDTVREELTVAPRGEVVARVCLDRVSVRRPRATAWSEVELELVAGADPAWLDRLEGALLAAGGRPAAHESKVGRALASARPFEAPTSPDAPAGDVVRAYLAAQVGVLQALEAAVIVDEPDAVHRSRVATRRLRSALRVFAPVLDRGRIEPLRDELKWLGEVLGAPRDAEVLLEEFGDLLAELGPEVVTPEVRGRLLASLEQQHATAHAALVRALASGRHADLRAVLAGLVAEPPLLAAAGGPAASVLPPLVRRAVERVETLYDLAEQRPRRLERWHDVRKAAKAVRYCSEALTGAFGPPARELVKAWKGVTESFGVLQDAVVARELLEDALARARDADEPLGPYRVLIEAQEDRRHGALLEGREALDAALALDVAALTGPPGRTAPR